MKSQKVLSSQNNLDKKHKDGGTTLPFFFLKVYFFSKWFFLFVCFVLFWWFLAFFFFKTIYLFLAARHVGS